MYTMIHSLVTSSRNFNYMLVLTPPPPHFPAFTILSSPLRVECLLKTDSGYPKEKGVTLFTMETLGIPSAMTPLSQLYRDQFPPSPIPGEEVLITSLTYSYIETRMDRP